MQKRLFTISVALLMVLCAAWRPAWAQQDVAALTGEVTDSSGAQVSGAIVNIVDTRTGAAQETKTESNGSYRFLRLQPGPGYILTVKKDGFQSYSLTNLYLAVATTRTQNVQLELGSFSQTVEVTSEGSVTLNTTDSTIGNNFDMRAVGSLPNEFRDDPAALLRLQPGVVNAQSEQTGANSATDPTGSRDGSVAGARADQNNITVDGIDATDFTIGQSFRTQAAIPVEAIQEFSTQVADITPAYGGRGGAQTIITTKGGSNNWHGSAHEYNRTAATEANTFFNNASGVPRTNLVRNQFGADLGGPVKRDKLFFFFDYEGRRDAQQINELQVVPLAHVKAGGIAYINNVSTATGSPCPTTSRLTAQDVSTDCVTVLSAAQVTALDPCSQAGGCPNAPGFTAPGIAPALLNLFQTRYPAANDLAAGDGLNTGGFRFNAPNPLVENSYVTRLDYNLSSKHKLFGRFNFRHEDSVNLLIQFPGDPLTGPNIVRDYAWVLGETWTVSPSTVNQLIIGETRSDLNQPILFNPSGGLVELSFFGGSLSTPYERQSQIGHVSPVPTFRDDLTLLRGRHTIQLGVEVNPNKVRSTLTNNFDFIQEGLGGSISSLPSNLRPANILQDPSGIATGNWDNFFVGALGIINNDQSAITYTKNGTVIPQGAETHRRDYRTNLYAGYVQDTFKVRSDLSLTAGVRYQYAPTPYEVNGLQASFVNTSLNQILQTRLDNGLSGVSGPDATPQLTYQLTGAGNHDAPPLYDADKLNFSPRLALAWNPSFRTGLFGSVFGDRKTVVRAQASLIYDQTVINAITNLEDQGNYVFGNTVATNFGGGGANASLQSDPRFNSASAVPFPVVAPPFSNTVTPNAIFNYGLDNHLHTPYSETFSLGVQRELPAGFQLEVDFFGRYGRRLFALADAAQIVDFTDPASKHTFVGDSVALENLARRNVNPSNVAPLPFFENELPAGTGLTCPQINQEVFGTPFATCTQAVYALNQTALQQGNLSGVALGIFGLVPPNVVIPSQFFVNALGTNKGYSSYNAMFVTLRKRLSRNLQLDFNYTFSHSIDNSSIIANNNANFVAGTTEILCNPYDLSACKGNSEFDATHQISSDFVYDLPVGRNQFIGRNSARWLNEIIGGWQASGIITWRTGLALDAVGGGSTTSLAADNGANFNGNSYAVRSNIHTDANGQIQFFADPTAALGAFSFVTGMQTGSRDTLRGPHFSDFDLGVAKNFPLFGEKYRLQFRADAFNAFNHPNFGLPDSGITSSTFGVITTLAGQEPSRVMQLSLRFDF
jgi:Carboxypeptidase regulatory-like domain